MRDLLIHDLRHAVRQLVSRPGFSLVAVLTLTLGLGATTAMYSLLRSTVLAPLPYPDADRLVRIQETTPEGKNFSVSAPNFFDFRERTQALDRLVAMTDRPFTLTGAGEPVRLAGLAVSRGYFEVLGGQPLFGRGFLDEEDQPANQEPVVVLSHALWQQRFAADPRIVGGDIHLDDTLYRVVGVMPADFRWFDTKFWIPLRASPDSDRSNHTLSLIGRLAPNSTMEQASTELNAIAATIGQAHPRIAGWGVRMMTLRDWQIGSQYRQGVYLLLAAVSLLLGIACVNLANLLFVRAFARQGEIGLRSALGASRSRIARQWFTEVMVLTAIGVVGGLVLAELSIELLLRWSPEGIPRLQQVRIDGGVFTFAALTGLATALLFGLAPAWRAARLDSALILQHGGRTGPSHGQRRLSSTMVVAQVALSALLLVGAGILMRSFVSLQTSDPGYDPEHMLAVSLQLNPADYGEDWQRVAFFKRLDESLGALPGVTSTGAVVNDPFSGNDLSNRVTPVELANAVGPSGYMQARWRIVTPGFFRTVGLPLLDGEVFDIDTRDDGPRNVVVTASTAERLWPGQSALGKRFYWGGTGGEPMTVTGVVGDYEDVKLGGEVTPTIFLRYSQWVWPDMTVLVRTHGDIAGTAAAIRDRIRKLDPNLPVPEVQTLRGILSDSIAGPRMRTVMLGVFALAALLLAAIGIYGVMAFNFASRRRELGLRLAVGAKPGGLMRMLLLGGARLVLIGSSLGAIGAWLLGRTLSSLIEEASGVDPLAFVGALVVLGIVAMAAVYFPARQTLRTAPLETLRDA